MAESSHELVAANADHVQEVLRAIDEPPATDGARELDQADHTPSSAWGN